ncbi:MAG: tyrosine-type recombinase/integrase [Candidatus Edwardsbacteria bacterium]
MRIYKRGKIWYIDYTYKGKRIRKRIGQSKSVAELTLKDIEVKIAKGKHLGIHESQKILFEDFAKQYLEYAKTNKSANTYRLNITNLRALIPFFKEKYLSEIVSQEIERYKTERLKNVTPASVNRDLACLRHLFNKAIEWGYVSTSPMKGVKQLKEPPGRLRFLSKEEIQRLFAELPYGSKTIVLFALYTGLRKSEILNLRWSEVDFKNRMIIVEKTKTNERRIIPMNQAVYKQLQEISIRRNGDLVFSDEYRKNLRKNFETALKKVSIEDFRFHDLRHTFASYLVMNGASLKVAQQLLGHKDIKMTMRYSHLSQDHLQDAVNRLDFVSSDGTNLAQSDRATKLSSRKILKF